MKEQRKKIVAGNWKMNTSLDEAVELVKEIAALSKQVSGVQKIVFPPFPFIKTIRELLVDERDFLTGAQNCSEHDKGAYTGEVSAAMLRNVGCRYVLVGHSERRNYFAETDSQLYSKVQQVLQNHMSVIYCFGEQLQDRKTGNHFKTVEQQLKSVLLKFPHSEVDRLILAYEPVWAIGTGETASPQQAQEMHAFVRGVIAELFDQKKANAMSILYGGSCNAKNAGELFACEDVDGGLIGGASLKADDFCKIIQSF